MFRDFFVLLITYTDDDICIVDKMFVIKTSGVYYICLLLVTQNFSKKLCKYSLYPVCSELKADEKLHTM